MADLETAHRLAIHPIDLGIIVVYLVAITAVGILSSRKQAQTTSGYFLAGRSLRCPEVSA